MITISLARAEVERIMKKSLQGELVQQLPSSHVALKSVRAEAERITRAAAGAGKIKQTGDTAHAA